MKFVLLTYATEEFESGRIGMLSQIENLGFSRVISKGPSDFMSSSFARKHNSIVTCGRGAGYWLWKPYYIMQAIESMRDDEVLIYSDVGRGAPYRFDRPPIHLAELAQKNGFVIGPKIPQHGPIKMWTKRDCLVGLAKDSNDIAEQPMVQATWSVWTKSDLSRSFVQLWLDACTNPAFLTDQDNILGKDNYSQFIDHRHDQSILSVLSAGLNEQVLDLTRYNVYRLFKLRPNSNISHTFLKSISNVEDILSGSSVALTMIKHHMSQRQTKSG